MNSFRAKNDVTSTSNGKRQDGIYPMFDRSNPHTHGDGTDSNGIKLDSDEGSYGSGGIYRSENFMESEEDGKYRYGMGIHAGRENSDF